jgi:hypothetical protein
VAIKNVRPTTDDDRVRLRKAVIELATAFISTYRKPKVINPPSDPEQINLLTKQRIK